MGEYLDTERRRRYGPDVSGRKTRDLSSSTANARMLALLAAGMKGAAIAHQLAAGQEGASAVI